VQDRTEQLVDTGLSLLRSDQVPTEHRLSARTGYRKIYRLVALTDSFSVAAALLLAYWARFSLRLPTKDFLLSVVGAPFAVVGMFTAFRLYDAYRFTPAEEFRRIILAVSLALTALVTLSFWSHSEFSREWLALSWVFALLFALISRRLWHRHLGKLRSSGKLSFPTLIVGTNEEARHLEEVLASPALGFTPIGAVSTSAADPRANGLPLLGNVRDLRNLIHESGAECVFVAASALSPGEMNDVAKAVRLEGVEVRVTATLPDVLSSRLSVQPLGGLTALSLRPVELSGTQMVAKRAFDLVAAIAGLMVLSPFLTIMALSVRLNSPGPIFYRQRRVGHRGRPFTMLKFRTMREGSEGQVEELRRAHGVNNLMFKLPDDPRVTRVGRFLRRFSLDELPQLINVLRGEMSIVGPRPPLPQEVMHYQNWQFDRLEVPPGLTGLWQVSGRSNLSFDECVRLDLFYIENWSLAYDLYICAKTVPVLLSRRGAY
jgi:exopolysaccharide biosynthesis polyprenyl glycosylphosphotransferase